jgi:peptidoglycan-associated lipoprotein
MLTYGMTNFSRLEMAKSIDKINWGSGRTPLGRTIGAAGDDLKGYSGRSAIIIVSDFEENPGVDDIRAQSVMENIAKVKAQYGDRLCISTIQIGEDVEPPGGRTLTKAIKEASRCGLDVSAEELLTPEAMTSFVRQIFMESPSPTETGMKPSAEGEVKAEGAKSAALPAAAGVTAAAVALENIHFDFDKSVLRKEDRAILKKHAAWLMENKNYTVMIEGNCDERGTDEYNLALGEKRAMEAKRYLKTLGVDASRIKTISYGKERPLDPGHNEEAWAKNRRDQFVLTKIE